MGAVAIGGAAAAAFPLGDFFKDLERLAQDGSITAAPDPVETGHRDVTAESRRGEKIATQLKNARVVADRRAGQFRRKTIAAKPSRGFGCAMTAATFRRARSLTIRTVRALHLRPTQTSLYNRSGGLDRHQHHALAEW
jgi:hypothetical protein